jgi:hypothetical protein
LVPCETRTSDMTMINAKIKAILRGIVFRNAYATDLEPQQATAQILSLPNAATSPTCGLREPPLGIA